MKHKPMYIQGIKKKSSCKEHSCTKGEMKDGYCVDHQHPRSRHHTRKLPPRSE